jgi:hypothetical protein
LSFRVALVALRGANSITEGKQSRRRSRLKRVLH